jgi:glycosyltransferase involved in cell wall biosynthesis
MKIGIDASRAFIKNRTGIEEYSFQVIKNLAYRQAGLMDKFDNHQVVLYIRRNQEVGFELPVNWRIKKINCFRLWTQVGLSLEMLFHPVDTLFIPAHTVPIIHPKNTVVVIHGLEYEFCPKAYSFWERIYMRCVIKNSCKWAKKIIAVSENTKKDLMKIYEVAEEKIKVIYEGSNLATHNPQPATQSIEKGYRLQVAGCRPYLLFIGRLEERKNICGIIEAFEILKEKYQIPHKLILAGGNGYGYKNSKFKIQNSKFRNDIISKGFVSEEEKFDLLKNADIFLFPSFYEGFGLPILEAQAAGVPVVASIEASIPEIAGESAILIDPKKPEQIVEATYKLISDENLRNDIIKKGLENVKRFSWEKCAGEIAKLLVN